MKTSTTVKHWQRHPLTIRWSRDNRWGVTKGPENPVHVVTQVIGGFRCDCPATSLCCHVITVVKHELDRTGYRNISFWTNVEDLRPQHRHAIKMRYHRQEFWVTANLPSKEQREINRVSKRVRWLGLIVYFDRIKMQCINTGARYYLLRDRQFKANEELLVAQRQLAKLMGNHQAIRRSNG